MSKISTQDYHYLLDSAENHLKELSVLYNNSVHPIEVPRHLTNKIRYFLTDIESALDYIAFQIFISYCVQYINDPNKIETKKKRVNFPLYDSKGWFDKKIIEMFPGLKSTRPDLIQLFESHQPFVKGKNYWLPVFNKLVNNNKHRELEKQTRNQITHVAYGQLPGLTITDCTFINVGTPISFNGTSIDFVNKTSYDNNFIANTRFEYVFKDTKLSVLPTLAAIFEGARSVIDEIDFLLERE